MNQTPEELARRIEAASARERAERPQPSDTPNADSGAGRAFGAAADLAAGVLVGAFIGYWIDRWWGTHPWMMILFLFLGFGAGLANINRSLTGQNYKVGYREDKKADKE